MLKSPTHFIDKIFCIKTNWPVVANDCTQSSHFLNSQSVQKIPNFLVQFGNHRSSFWNKAPSLIRTCHLARLVGQELLISFSQSLSFSLSLSISLSHTHSLLSLSHFPAFRPFLALWLTCHWPLKVHRGAPQKMANGKEGVMVIKNIGRFLF